MLIIRVVRFRTLKFQPRIMTSFRPHGKWGDLLVCLIPTLWCINILINSNFLLKLIEWQIETSLFTIRIRGKQWYWIYKFDVKDVADILSYGKNVGNNKLYFPTPNGLNNLDDYLHLIQLRASKVWLKKYWNVSLRLQPKEDKEFLVSSTDQIPSVPLYFANNKNMQSYTNDLYNVILKIRKTSNLLVSNQLDKLSRQSAFGENFLWNNEYGIQTLINRGPNHYLKGVSIAENRSIYYRHYEHIPEFMAYYDNIVDYLYTVFRKLHNKNYYEYLYTHKSYCSTKLFKNTYDTFYLNTFFKKYCFGLKVYTGLEQVGKVSSMNVKTFFPNATIFPGEEITTSIMYKFPRYSEYHRRFNIHNLTPLKRPTFPNSKYFFNEWISEFQTFKSKRQNLHKKLYLKNVSLALSINKNIIYNVSKNKSIVM